MMSDWGLPGDSAQNVITPTLGKSKITIKKQQNLFLDVISFFSYLNESKRHWLKFSFETSPLTSFPSLPLSKKAFPSGFTLMNNRSKLHPEGANRAATPTLISSPWRNALPALLARCSLDWRRLWCANRFELQTLNSHWATLIFILLQQDLQAGDQQV